MPDQKLTPKQKRFIEEYLIDLNATQAAKRAGYGEKSAYSVGQRLLKHVEIQSQIVEAQVKRSQRTGITQDRVLQEFARIGFSDIRKMLTKTGSLLDPQDWDDDTAAAISSIEVVTNSGEHGKDEDGRKIIERTHKIKVWDKNNALEKIAKHLGMFVDRHEHTGKDGDPIKVQAIAWQIVDPETTDS